MHTQRGNKNKLNQTSVSLQSPPSSLPVESGAAEVREGKQSEEEEKEERERVAALLQRKKLLQELGLAEQLHRLLQGCTAGGAVVVEGSIQQSREQAHHKEKVRGVLSGWLLGHRSVPRDQCLCLHVAGPSDTDLPTDESTAAAAAALSSSSTTGNI